MNRPEKIKYSVIVPAYNEAEAVGPLHQEIKEAMNNLGEPYEIIFVDDGSSDGTFKNLTQLTPIKIIKFRKNFGQTAALDAGFKYAQGEIIFTLDGDGQNDPADISKLLEELNKGYDLVSGWRHNRKDPFLKNVISRGADFLRKFFISDKIHDSGCSLKAYRRECLENLNLYGEMHRFIAGVLKWQGFKVGEVKVNHRPRKTGQTKYNWKRIVKGFIDMISVWFWRKYSGRPLHLFGGLGLLIGGAGFILGSYLTIARLLGLISLRNRIWPLVAVFMVLAGLQLFISGLLADIAVKTYYNNRRTVYNIEKIVEKNQEETK